MSKKTVFMVVLGVILIVVLVSLIMTSGGARVSYIR